MAEDKERKALSKTSRWENELCQAAREIAEDNLDVDEAILAAVLGDRGLFVLTNRALLLMDEKKRKLLWNLPLAEIQDLRVEGRGGGGWMDWRTSGGVHKEPLVGDWSLFQQAVEEHLGIVEKEKILWNGRASYIGGHPEFIKGDKSEGNLRLTEQALEYTGGTVTIRLLVSDIIEGSLGTYQPGIIRRMLVGDSRVLADVRNMLLVDFDYRGTRHRAEFEIRGALTVPGNADRARELLNTLSSIKAKFYQPSDGQRQSDESNSMAPAESFRPICDGQTKRVEAIA
ncbi:MAG: hypothetical protein J4N26_02005 [Chloroflexi bacterium]|nr:hypothetical protein [Chloroflexota bacterium]